MNVTTLAREAALPLNAFALAYARVNEWRGRCLDAFTRAEVAVTETLIHLAEVPDRGSQVRLPHLVGQRYAAIAAAVAADGPFAAEGGGAAKALDRFRAHDGLRNMLCHGAAKVTLDTQGRWTLVLRVTALRSGLVSRYLLAIEEDEATALCSEVCRASQALSSRLGQVRSELTAQTTSLGLTTA